MVRPQSGAWAKRSRDRDVVAGLRVGADAPRLGGRPMAQDGAGATREHGGETMSRRAKMPMTDDVHRPVNSGQQTGANRATDRCARVPKRHDLRASHHPTLAVRERDHSLQPAIRMQLSSLGEPKCSRVSHAASLAGDSTHRAP